MPDATFDWLMANDAKQVGFRFARYKFVAKCFAGYGRVLEIGCGNGVVGSVVKQAVRKLEQVDLPVFDLTRDFLSGYNGVFCLDVLEHIQPDKTFIALANLRRCAPVCIIGMPSLESQPYASAGSKRDHVNCMSGEDLRCACKKHWDHVFMFGMNDEVLHTGFLPMSHYLLALCVGANQPIAP